MGKGNKSGKGSGPKPGASKPGAGFPAKTGKPSGGQRTNNPPARKGK